MLNLSRPLPATDQSGAKLPMPLHGLAREGAELRRSEVSMIAGQPGAGKSALALHLAVHARCPCLYIAADTSRQTMRTRTLAMLTGRAQDEVEGDPDTEGVLTSTRHVWFSFDSSPDMDSIRGEAEAVLEVTGAHPHLIVIDNLIDISEGGDNEWSALRRTMKELKEMARDTGAAVLVCHHTSEGVQHSAAPPRSAIQGKVAQLPALILTVDSARGSGLMTVGIVKNRHGSASAQGAQTVSLTFDAARMRIADGGLKW